MRQPPTDLTRSLILPAIAVMACVASLLLPAGARGDVIYRCVRKDGETIISFNRKLDGMKCSVHENLDREPSKPKGAKCHTQRYRDTIFYKCEKNGVWYIFNKASKSGGDATASGDSGSSGTRNDGDVANNVGEPAPDGGKVVDLPGIVAAAAEEFGVPAGLLMAIIEVESGFNPDVVSPVGAQGLMQLMPVTADYLEVQDPFDPVENVRAGARLIRLLSDRFDGDIELVLAAYNAGAGAVKRAGGVPDACRGYVTKVISRYRRNLDQQ
ncbi:lytic transglycosylase domain-containing protein [Myxococcota bacterium]|nr:lytic transglycosylase domain-containing protein [Myxococcota bacterium]